jgi:deoxycytidylate deaminase
MVKRVQQEDMTAFAYDKRGRLISVGRNSYVKTHPLQAHYASRSSNVHRIYLHAELDALIKARGKQVHKMVVVRVTKTGRYASAAPCDSCALALREYGVRHVEHT